MINSSQDSKDREYSVEQGEVILRWEWLEASIKKSSICFIIFFLNKRDILFTNTHLEVQEALPLTL